MSIICAHLSLWAQSQSFEYIALENPILDRFKEEFGKESTSDEVMEIESLSGEYEFWEAMAFLRKGDRNDVRNIRNLLKLSGEKGFAPSYAMLSSLSRSGASGFRKSTSQANSWLEKAAMGGDGYSMVQLAEILFLGEDLEKDIKKAKDYLNKALEKGTLYYDEPSDPRLYQIGTHPDIPLKEEDLVSVSVVKSRKNRAISFVYYYLGRIADEEKDLKSAHEYYLESSNVGIDGRDGYSAAAIEVAKNYAFGEGIEKNTELSHEYLNRFRKLLERTIEDNTREAAAINPISLLFFQTGKLKINEKLDTALSELQTIIAQQFADEASELFNPQEAMSWYSLAVESDLDWAKLGLAELLSRSSIEIYNPEKSFQIYADLYHKNRNVLAGVNLAICYANGFGVEANLDKSKEIISRYEQVHYFAWLISKGESFSKPIGQTEIEARVKKDALKGDPEAMAFYGLNFISGNGVEKSLDTAQQWFKKSAAAGNMIGEAYLAETYYNSDSNALRSQGIKLLRSSYDKGSLYAKVMIKQWRERLDWLNTDVSLLNFTNRDFAIIENNKFKINIEFLNEQKKLIEDYLNVFPDDGYSLNSLALLCTKFHEVDKNLTDDAKEEWVQKSITLFHQAIEDNYFYADYNLGKLYFEGKLVDQDYEKAKEHFLEAAESDHARASYYLGKIYSEGLGVIEDPDRAAQYFSFAGIRYDTGFDQMFESQDYLIRFYSEGKHGSIDFEKANFWTNIMFKILTNDYGYFYRDVTSNKRISLETHLKFIGETMVDRGQYDEALTLFDLLGISTTRFSEGGYSFGKSHAAELRLIGKVKSGRNVGWVERELYTPILKMNPYAYYVGAIYYRGMGDLDKSICYYRKAVQLGDANAFFDLGLCYWNGIGMNRNEDEAMYYFKRAANKKLPEALITIALLSLYDYEGAPDLEIALSYAEEAEIRGHPLAIYLIHELQKKMQAVPAGSLYFDGGVAMIVK